jgi:hypothetical protein
MRNGGPTKTVAAFASFGMLPFYTSLRSWPLSVYGFTECLQASEQKRKQDCELKAARRLLEAVRKDFPQLRLCLSLDAPYAGGAGFALGQDFKASFVIVFKEGSIPTLWQEFQALLTLCPDNRLEVTEDGWRHEYRWVDELPYTDSDRRE